MQISLNLAQRLKNAGLLWQPKIHDFFAIPETSLEDRVFVLSDMTVAEEVLHGMPAFTFVGAVEWALDYILQTDAVWMPTESQLRHQLQIRLADAPQPALTLKCSPLIYICGITLPDQKMEFAGSEASEAYAHALHWLLTRPEK